MNDKIIRVATVLGGLAIIFGAFGAHILKKHLDSSQLVTFETGVRYQMYHAFFLLFIGLNTTFREKIKKTVSVFAVIGVILFSGSIYLLSTKNISGIDFKFIGIVTPLGGLFMILAWFYLFLETFKIGIINRKKNSL